MLGCCAFTVKGLGSIPDWRTKIPQAVWHGQINKLTNLKNIFYFHFSRISERSSDKCHRALLDI